MKRERTRRETKAGLKAFRSAAGKGNAGPVMLVPFGKASAEHPLVCDNYHDG